MGECVLSVVLPTYNEAENIKIITGRIAGLLRDVPHEIIVADDDSHDRTWEIAEKLSSSMPQVRCIRRMKDKGLYPAVLDAFAVARGRYMAVMDADLQHDENLLLKMLEEMKKGNHMAIGSRYLPGGGIENWNFFRRLVSRAANALAGLILKRQSTDMMSGFFMIEREMFLLTAHKLRPKGFKILMDILQNLPSGTKVSEVGYTFRPRQSGESKLDNKVIFQTLQSVWELSLGRYVSARFLLELLIAFFIILFTKSLAGLLIALFILTASRLVEAFTPRKNRS